MAGSMVLLPQTGAVTAASHWWDQP